MAPAGLPIWGPMRRSRWLVRFTAVVERYNGLFGFELPYMMVVQEAPRGADDWHLGIELYPPHRTRDLLKIRASVETATGLFINDTLPEASAKLLAAIPTAPRKEHPGFVVERTE